MNITPFGGNTISLRFYGRVNGTLIITFLVPYEIDKAVQDRVKSGVKDRIQVAIAHDSRESFRSRIERCSQEYLREHDWQETDILIIFVDTSKTESIEV
jgi:hypothetical protein